MKETTDNDRISRKEAVSKISKYVALTALGTFMILNPQKAQAGSPTPPGAGGSPWARSSSQACGRVARFVRGARAAAKAAAWPRKPRWPGGGLRR